MARLLSTRDVRLPGGAARTVHLTLRVPGDATPGSHYAGVVGVDRRTLRRTVPATFLLRRQRACPYVG